MSSSKRFLKDVLIYSLGNFGSRFLGFLLLPFYTSVLSQADYGYIDLLTTGSVLFITLVSLKLFDSAYRFVWDAKELQQRAVIVSTIFFSVMAVALLGLGGLSLAAELQLLSVPMLGVLILWMLLRIPTEFLQQVSRALGRNHVYSVSGLVLSVGLAGASLVLLGHFRLGLAGYLWGTVGAYALTLAYCLVASSALPLLRPSAVSWSALKPMLAYALPLLPAALSWWIIRMSGRYFLTHSAGLAPVGLYAVSDKLPTLLYMVNLNFYMAWQDTVLRHYRPGEKDPFLQATFASYVRAGLSVVVLMVLFLKPFFTVMVGADYREAHIYVPWLLLAVVLLCVGGLYDVFFMAERRTRAILGSTLASAAVALIASAVLVPGCGLWGTVASTGLAAVVLLLIRAVQLRQVISLNLGLRDAIVLSVSFALAVDCYSLDAPLRIAEFAIALAALVYLNREMLVMLGARLRQKLLSRRNGGNS